MQNITHIISFIDTLFTEGLARDDALQLVADRLEIQKKMLQFEGQRTISGAIADQLLAELNELNLGKPLHRILGYRYFWQDKFQLSPDTLEPRPDTEILIETCLRYRPNLGASISVLDLGTGSGCILLSLLREYTAAKGTGVDISVGALDTAAMNAHNLGLDQQAHWVNSNWLENVRGTFDIIVSNPPYIPSQDILTLSPTVQTYDPLRALDGGKDGLDVYRYFAAELPTHMHAQTLVVLEIGYDQGESVPGLFQQAGFDVIDIVNDYGHNPRCVVLGYSKS